MEGAFALDSCLASTHLEENLAVDIPYGIPGRQFLERLTWLLSHRDKSHFVDWELDFVEI